MAGLLGATKKFVFTLVDSSEKIGEGSAKAVGTEADEINGATPLTAMNKKALNAITFKSLEKAASITIDTIDYSLTKSLNLTENYIGQQEVANLESQMGKVTSLATSIVSGVSMGWAGGPVGVAIGVGVSVATWGVGQFVNYNKELSKYYQQLNLTNAQTQWSAARRGLLDGARGTEN